MVGVPASTANGPVALAARYIVYETARAEAAHDTAIDVDDLVVAVTGAGEGGGSGGVVADAGGVVSEDIPPGPCAVIS